MSETTLLGSAIAAAGTVGAAAATAIIKALADGAFLKVSSEDRTILPGNWTGAIQMKEGVLATKTLSVRLNNVKISGSTFAGTAHLTCKDTEVDYDESFTVKGGFLRPTFLKLEYTNTTPGRLEFGSMILHFDSLGKNLNGTLAGYGALSGTSVYGTVSLKKS
jgi:hypothetical protein